ncbi:MAG: GIY-YIG nuclease family protein [Saprospirales bacterium]|nr:GIY-YIG nuclease family protein [Saprospirales bacterium]
MGLTRFAIIDVETTGGQAARDKITEIAIVLHDGEKILDTFETLINPECLIPGFISGLTGITNEMVADAPRFFEVARTVVEMTQDAIFVAHNARFDYSFIREEFRRLGYTYTRKTLCTVQLSRKSFPGLPSYSLGNLIRHFRISVDQRHRAMADTLATTEIFTFILQSQQGQSQLTHLLKMGIKESLLPNGFGIEKIAALPEECGVYYFHNHGGDVVYVGKSINIQKRIASHFQDKTHKAGQLQEHAREVTYELTGSELIALLLESREIKRLRPLINRAQRNRQYPYGIFSYTSADGYLCFMPAKTSNKLVKEKTLLAEYPHLESARNHLQAMVERFQLCEKRVGLDAGPGPCFPYQLGTCLGACIEQESPEAYNLRAQEAQEALTAVLDGHFVILDKGRTQEEQAAVVVENGRLFGWGYVSPDDQAHNLDDWKGLVKRAEGNAEENRLVKRFIEGKKVRVLAFPQK